MVGAAPVESYHRPRYRTWDRKEIVPPDEDISGHDIVVIGASAGGVEALRTIVSELPADLPAAVFVVLHIPAIATSVLPAILERAGDLSAAHAEDRAEIECGRIYVAPPDHHLLIQPGFMHVNRGPKENGYRPAIDPTFRTAAATYGSRVIGVVLSGVLDDGSAGLAAVKSHGGRALVQDPAGALYPMMPESAIQAAEPDLVLPPQELAAAIVSTVRETAPKTLVQTGDALLDDEGFIEIDRAASDSPQSGSPSGFVCPDCGGALWESEDESGLLKFRCRTGHGYSVQTLAAVQTEVVEGALWGALRALEERAAMARGMAARFRARGSNVSAARFERQADAAVQQAMTIRDALQQLSPLTGPVAPAP
jgi:two-component system, chemotaxis family, protein-glutamate methylesterase/glutaminase